MYLKIFAVFMLAGIVLGILVAIGFVLLAI